MFEMKFEGPNFDKMWKRIEKQAEKDVDKQTTKDVLELCKKSAKELGFEHNDIQVTIKKGHIVDGEATFTFTSESLSTEQIRMILKEAGIS